MNLLPSAIEAAVIDSMRDQIVDWFALERGRTSFTDEEWRRVVEHGWLSIGQSESNGGAGLGVLGEVLLLREIGRGLVPGPVPSTLLALRLAVEAGWPELAQGIRDGAVRVGWALSDGAQRLVVVGGEEVTQAVLLDDGGVHIVTLAQIQPQTDPPAEPVDPSLPVRTVGMRSRRSVAASLVDRARAPAWTLIAAQASGVAEAMLHRSVAYAKTRIQFGQPIGAFQAVAHRCADMAVRAEVAWLQTVMAALSLDEDRPDALAHAASARLLAVDHAVRSAADNIQNHGGIGFTTELPEHRFVKRAHALRCLDGDSTSVLSTLLGAAARGAT